MSMNMSACLDPRGEGANVLVTLDRCKDIATSRCAQLHTKPTQTALEKDQVPTCYRILP